MRVRRHGARGSDANDGSTAFRHAMDKRFPERIEYAAGIGIRDAAGRNPYPDPGK